MNNIATYILLMAAILFTTNTLQSQISAGPDKVICAAGSTVSIGDSAENSEYCYSWTATPHDAAILDKKTSSLKVAPSTTTIYKLTAIKDDLTLVIVDEVKVTVNNGPKVTVDFQETVDTKFGFDKTDGDQNVYVSLDRVGSTTINVTITPFTESIYYVTSSDPSKFKVPNDAVLIRSSNTAVELTGQYIGGDYASAYLQVRCGNKSGAILRQANIELYKKRIIPKVTFYRIKDATVPSTTPIERPSLEELKKQLNYIYRQVVIEVQSVDGDLDKDIRYDLNNNGYLDFYNGEINNQEVTIIRNAQLPGSPKVSYIEKIRDNWRLADPLKAGDSKIKLANLNGFPSSGQMNLGPPIGAPEIITIAGLNYLTNEVVLSKPLSHDHESNHTVYGGLAGLSNPILVTNENNELLTTIVHEALHNAEFGNLLDVKEPDNVMYWTTGGAAGYRRLRFRRQTGVNTGTGIPNGKTQNQWNSILRN